MKILVKNVSAPLREILDYTENTAAKVEFYENWKQWYKEVTIYNHWVSDIFLNIKEDAVIWEWVRITNNQGISDYIYSDLDFNLIADTTDNDAISLVLNYSK